MANKIDLKSKMPTLDDIFSTQEERDIEKMTAGRVLEVPLDMVDDFPNHPFKVIDDEDMQQLAESIKERGVITPAKVRKKEDGRYELISGHRRKRACEITGRSTLTAEVVDVDLDDATVLMVDSNLQRTHILPSEKAKSYKMKLDALKHQGKRTDLTSSPVGTKLRASDEISKQTGDSRNQIWRYIRLTELAPELLDMVDEGKIAFRPAVELSYLTQQEQGSLYETILSEEATPSLAQAIKMRSFSQAGRLGEEVILSIMQELKPNQKERLVLNAAPLKKYLPEELTPKKTEEYVLKALEHYHRYLHRQKETER